MSNIILLSAFRKSHSDKILHKMAAPFFELAERLTNAIENKPLKEDWQAILESNNFIWRTTADYMPRNFDDDVPAETTQTLKNIAAFMPRAGRAALNDPESDICGQMITLNRNMYDKILTMRIAS